MTALFITILNMSIMASVVALAVMLVRIPLKKAPKIFSYILWGIVLFRLVCPYNIITNFSLMPIPFETIPRDIIYSQNSAPQASAEFGDLPAYPEINKELPPVVIPENNNPINNAITNPDNAIPAEPESNTSIIYTTLNIAGYVWLFGFIALLLYATIGYIRLKRRVYYATLVCDNIYETDTIKTPFVLGFINPKIYMPIGIDPAQYNYIIKHEQIHIERFDHLIKPIVFTIISLHWFNPLMWAAYFFMSRDIEMSCDEAVLRKADEDIREVYSSALLNLSVKRGNLLTPLAFGESAVKGRVRNVLNFKKPPRVISVAAIALVAVLSVGFAVNGTNGTSGNNLLEFEVVFSNVTEYSRKIEFMLGDRLYSDYMVNGQIQTANLRGLKEIGYARDDFGRYRIFERPGYSINEFIVVRDYGLMNPATIYQAVNISMQNTMTLNDVRELAAKGSDLLFEDLRNFRGANASSQLYGYGDYLMVYSVEGGYRLIVHSGGTSIGHANLESIWERGGSGIDIRYNDVDEFIRENPSSPSLTAEEAQIIAQNYLGRTVIYIDTDWWERDDEFPHHSKDPAKQALDDSLDTIEEPTHQYTDNNGTFIAIGRRYGTIYEYSGGVWYKQPSPNTYLPQIMHNGVIYYLDSSPQIDIEFELTENTPRIKSTVSLTQIPQENGQANFGDVDAPYVVFEDGLFVLWNNKWTHFITFEQLTSSEQRNMTLADVRTFAAKGLTLTEADLEPYYQLPVYTGMYYAAYPVDGGNYMLRFVGRIENGLTLTSAKDTANGIQGIDIRYYDVDKYIADGTRELVRPLPEPPQYEVGNVTAISNGIEYEPYTHIYFSENLTISGMVSAERLPLSLEEAASVLPEIQIADDFNVVVSGQYATRVSYTLYDIYDNRFSVVYEKEDTIHPFLNLSRTRLYMLCVDVVWSNGEIEQQNREAIGLQYVFKVST